MTHKLKTQALYFHQNFISNFYQRLHALFNSHLQNACQLWGLTENTNSKHLHSPEESPPSNDFRSPSTPLFLDLEILKFLTYSNIFVKFLNHRLLSDLLNFFQFTQLDPDVNKNQGTRGANLRLLFVPTFNTITFGMKSFTKITITQWNSLQRAYPNINFDEISCLHSLPLGHTKHLQGVKQTIFFSNVFS